MTQIFFRIKTTASGALIKDYEAIGFFWSVIRIKCTRSIYTYRDLNSGVNTLVSPSTSIPGWVVKR